MDNYSLSQRLFHHATIGSKLVTRMSYEIDRLAGKSVADVSDRKNVYISGMARAGTTALLNALYDSGAFASLTYRHMPFVLAPTIWSKFASNSDGEARDRAHGDGIKIDLNSPEALEEVYWMTLSEREAFTNYSAYISAICGAGEKERYLCKSNQNIIRIKRLAEMLPNSIFLVPFRDPVDQATSILSQHKRFCELQRENRFIHHYLKWVGHREFGTTYRPIVAGSLLHTDPNSIDHWLEQWERIYQSVLKISGTHSNVLPVSYERLCNDVTYRKSVFQRADVEHVEDGFRPFKPKLIPKADKKMSYYQLYASLNDITI